MLGIFLQGHHNVFTKKDDMFFKLGSNSVLRVWGCWQSSGQRRLMWCLDHLLHLLWLFLWPLVSFDLLLLSLILPVAGTAPSTIPISKNTTKKATGQIYHRVAIFENSNCAVSILVKWPETVDQVCSRINIIQQTQATSPRLISFPFSGHMYVTGTGEP